MEENPLGTHFLYPLRSDLTTVNPFPEDEALTHLYIPVHGSLLDLFIPLALLAVQL